MKKQKHEFMDKYKCIIDWDADDQIFVARFPELKGCASHGETRQEATENAQVALQLYLDSLKERNIMAPMPIAMVKASGKFPTRTTPEIHQALLNLAAEVDTSMNALVDEALHEYVRNYRNRHRDPVLKQKKSASAKPTRSTRSTRTKTRATSAS